MSTSERHYPVLHTVAWEGDTTLLEKMLRAGEDADTRDEWQMTPIMSKMMRHGLQEGRCIFQGREAIQRNLILNCQEEDAERTAMTNSVVKLFLKFGADSDARSEREKTALHYAQSDGLYEAAQILLDAGANIDAQDKDARSPLFYAVQERSLLVTNLLLSHGASIDLQDKDGISPLSLVIQKGSVDMMQIFINHHELVATRDRLDFVGEVLLQAVEAKSADIVRFVVDSEYVGLDYQNAKGETAMHQAIAQGDTQVMRTLRELDTDGRSLRVATARGENCLHFAARVASIRELELVVQFADQLGSEAKKRLVNGLDGTGATPLFTAAITTEALNAADKTKLFRDRKATMSLLLAQGAVLLHNGGLPGGSSFRRSSSGSGVVLCAQVRRCLTQWFAECDDESRGELVREFCSQWIGNVPVQSTTTTMLSVLNMSICAGYAVDAVPLLLMLAQEEAAIEKFLQSFDIFESSSNGFQTSILVFADVKADTDAIENGRLLSRSTGGKIVTTTVLQFS